MSGLTDEWREVLFKAGDHDPTHCDCDRWDDYGGHGEFCQAFEDTCAAVAAIVAEQQATALRDAADDWARVIAEKYTPLSGDVPSWLRDRADSVETGAG